ncbi:hypothetical protein ACWOFR_11175 [Carnobacterium gallinarum]|uniref:hypothetical protein n=1 Tax=Carnobacterium gallinarum TaxID=2749 RepID=UPI000557B154|nr:hypothetical protein [Carnobacterium gallinarum]
MNKMNAEELNEFLGRQKVTTKFTFHMLKEDDQFKVVELKNEPTAYHFITSHTESIFELIAANERI